MKRLILLLALLVPGLAQAQSWTPAQQEVIDFIDNCQQMSIEEDYDVWFDACWHEDIVYVDPASNPTAQIDRAYGRGLRPANRLGVREVHRRMTPISVKVYGDTAVIYYYLRIVRIAEDGSRMGAGARGVSSETVIRRDGAWKVINKNDWDYPPR